MNFCSVSINPGKTGTFFYTRAFQKLGINASYKALQCSSLQEIDQLIKSRIYSGISVSMPFKSEIHKLCVETDASTFNGQFINTLKINRKGKVTGFNTDLAGVKSAISNLTSGDIAIYGAGAMGRLFSIVLTESSMKHQIFSRKAGNWNEREASIDNVINCTPIGMNGVSTPINTLEGVRFVVDLVINGKKLEGLAKEYRVPYFSGMDFYLNVFTEQFEIYTDQGLSNNIIDSINEEWKNRAP